jgi:hypothetical protein
MTVERAPSNRPQFLGPARPPFATAQSPQSASLGADNLQLTLRQLESMNSTRTQCPVPTDPRRELREANERVAAETLHNGLEFVAMRGGPLTDGAFTVVSELHEGRSTAAALRDGVVASGRSVAIEHLAPAVGVATHVTQGVNALFGGGARIIQEGDEIGRRHVESLEATQRCSERNVQTALAAIGDARSARFSEVGRGGIPTAIDMGRAERDGAYRETLVRELHDRQSGRDFR